MGGFIALAPHVLLIAYASVALVRRVVAVIERTRRNRRIREQLDAQAAEFACVAKSERRAIRGMA